MAEPVGEHGNKEATDGGASEPTMSVVIPSEHPSDPRREVVAIGDLRAGLSPRKREIDVQHVKVLEELLEQLPPILVHRPTMKVVDGLHRLTAWRRRGATSVPVLYVEGDEIDAFIRGVQMNVAHGKPLTTEERTAAVASVLRVRPHFSDRAIAQACGVSAKTVANLRARATEEGPQLNARVGLDGRVRSCDGGAGRERAAELIRKNPTLSLRKIAMLAEVSASTVFDVQNRIREGLDPVPERWARRRGTREPDGAAPDSHPVRVSSDAAYASTERGQEFARWFDSRAVDKADWQKFVDEIPLSRVYEVADEARKRSESWTMFAAALEGRVR